MWDLTTALDIFSKSESQGLQQPTHSPNSLFNSDGGPSSEELIRLLDHCELSNSHASTPCCISPSPSLMTNNSAGGGRVISRPPYHVNNPSSNVDNVDL